MIRATLNNVAEFSLHVTSILAIVGLIPLSLDVRLGVALLHSVAILCLQAHWPAQASRYLLLSSFVLVIAYGTVMHVQGPARLLAKTFGLAAVQPSANRSPLASAHHWPVRRTPTQTRPSESTPPTLDGMGIRAKHPQKPASNMHLGHDRLTKVTDQGANAPEADVAILKAVYVSCATPHTKQDANES